MHKHVLVPSVAVTLVTMLMLGAPAGLQSQTPSREAVEEAARKASPHSADAAMEYLESGDRQKVSGGHREGL